MICTTAGKHWNSTGGRDRERWDLVDGKGRREGGKKGRIDLYPKAGRIG
jgi:hypothetical protein